jgi:hypothetical protein
MGRRLEWSSGPYQNLSDAIRQRTKVTTYFAAVIKFNKILKHISIFQILSLQPKSQHGDTFIPSV